MWSEVVFFHVLRWVAMRMALCGLVPFFMFAVPCLRGNPFGGLDVTVGTVRFWEEDGVTFHKVEDPDGLAFRHSGFTRERFVWSGSYLSFVFECDSRTCDCRYYDGVRVVAFSDGKVYPCDALGYLGASGHFLSECVLQFVPRVFLVGHDDLWL